MNLEVSAQPATAASDADALPGERDPATDTSPFVIPRLVDSVLARWRRWAATALAGALTAILLSLAFPPAYHASTLLALRQPDPTRGDPAKAMATDVQLVMSKTVASRAAELLGLDLPPEQLVSTYQAIPLTDQILRITVTAPTEAESRRRADGVAQAFLGFRRELIERQSRLAVEALESRRAALDREVAEVEERIRQLSAQATPPAPQPDGLPRLRARRNALVQRQPQLDRAMVDAALAAATVVDNSSVVDRATSNRRAPLKALASNLAAGLVGGTAVGMGLVVIQEFASDRVRRREDVMSALGTPLALTVGVETRQFPARFRSVRRHLYNPQGDLERMVRHLRRWLSASGGTEPALVVVSVESDRPAAMAVAATGVQLAREGKRVLLVDVSARSVLAKVLGLESARPTTIEIPHSNGLLQVGFPPTLQETVEEWRAASDVVVVLATLDPAVGAWHLADWAVTSVAVVTAGRSTASVLSWTGQMLRAAGLDLWSVVLVGADPKDRSVFVPEGGLARVPLASQPVHLR